MNELYDYCPADFSGTIKDILLSSFDITDYSKIESEYNVFRKNFYYPFCHGVRTIPRVEFKPKAELENFFDASYVVGVDLPVLIRNKRNSNNQTIIILGEDPLRGLDNKSNEVILSTPFATHFEKYREKGMGRIYWNVSQYLLNNGFNIYYTDVNKIWLCQSKENGKINIPPILASVFKNTLRNEINSLKPRAIVAFGGLAKNTLVELKQSNGIPIKHPAARNWKTILGQPTYNNRINYIIEQLNAHLSTSNIDKKTLTSLTC